MSNIPTPRTDAFRERARTQGEAIQFEQRLERELARALQGGNRQHEQARESANQEKHGVEKAREEFAQIVQENEKEYAIHGKEPWELF